MYPEAYIQYLVLFHGDRDYFECHDVLEDHWKKDPKGKRKDYWVGLIQLAVTLYHYRRQNIVGAKKMIQKTIVKLEPYKGELLNLGINFDELMGRITQLKKDMNENVAFHDLNIPLQDQKLDCECIRRCEERHIQWCGPSPMDHIFLINKHKLRKR